ncbi:hypothetical protein AVEN_4526-1 [Araneus ventricosus]|uniref:Uncharacterized protein n=1 Tax=Araneus ventricosus TaxID=182803 RepID=A0A4Y2BNH9_ARAVE|nr:hypothetical protein AVEN_4526-1 [Araneus ventricosus]
MYFEIPDERMSRISDKAAYTGSKPASVSQHLRKTPLWPRKSNNLVKHNLGRRTRKILRVFKRNFVTHFMDVKACSHRNHLTNFWTTSLFAQSIGQPNLQNMSVFIRKLHPSHHCQPLSNNSSDPSV